MAQTCMQGRKQGKKANSGLRDRAQQQRESLGLLGTHHGLRALGAGPFLSRWGWWGAAPGSGSPRLWGRWRSWRCRLSLKVRLRGSRLTS